MAKNIVNGQNISDSEILSLEDLNKVISNYLNTSDFNIESFNLTPASDALIGFLAEHYRMTVKVNVTAAATVRKEELRLFVKVIPNDNKPKTKFIREKLFNKREAIMYNVFLKEFGGLEEPHPWRVPVLLCDEDVIVMPDLAARSFAPANKMICMDFEHCSTVLRSLGRLHAGSVNFEAKETLESGRRYTILDQYADILEEQVFKDGLLLRAAVTSLVNFCGTLSVKHNFESKYFHKIEKRLLDSYLDICESLKAYEEYPNVIIHRDLWANNILFRYDQVGKPSDAILLDFQCVRYVPGVFDVAMFLYLSTDKAFRDAHERELLDFYYDAFMSSVEYKEFGRIPKYSKEMFLESYESARAFGMAYALIIMPLVLMDAKAPEDVLDDPSTHDHYWYVDRSALMIDYAQKCPLYRSRLMDTLEEFIEKYIIVNED